MEEQIQKTKAIEPKPQKPDFLDLAQYKPQPVDDPKSHGLEFTEYIPDRKFTNNFLSLPQTKN